jgi:hypothetical protein
MIVCSLRHRDIRSVFLQGLKTSNLILNALRFSMQRFAAQECTASRTKNDQKYTHDAIRVPSTENKLKARCLKTV